MDRDVILILLLWCGSFGGIYLFGNYMSRLHSEEIADRLQDLAKAQKRIVELEKALVHVRKADRRVVNRGTEDQRYEDGPLGEIARVALE